jgi:hypothetical protein
MATMWAIGGAGMVCRRRYDGRQVSLRWTFQRPRFRLSVRKRARDARHMKDRRSKLLRAFVADIERAERPTKADEAWIARPSLYPFGIRDAVFCWLWANYDHVAQMRGGVPPRLGWEGFAAIMREDGVIGSRGEPPNANSVRRVWARVCREKEEQEAKKAAMPGL